MPCLLYSAHNRAARADLTKSIIFCTHYQLHFFPTCIAFLQGIFFRILTASQSPVEAPSRIERAPSTRCKGHPVYDMNCRCRIFLCWTKALSAHSDHCCRAMGCGIGGWGQWSWEKWTSPGWTHTGLVGVNQCMVDGLVCTPPASDGHPIPGATRGLPLTRQRRPPGRIT